jgi:fido (protein-threonine AMPylation protein)
MSLFEVIPGETPITDFSELKVKSIRYRRELNEVESKSIAKPMARYLALTITNKEVPMDFSWFCQLHREMFEDVWGWAGRLRRLETTIGIPPEHVEQRLYELVGNFPLWTDVPAIERAAMLHHKAVQIHPFENGNGR